MLQHHPYMKSFRFEIKQKLQRYTGSEKAKHHVYVLAELWKCAYVEKVYVYVYLW